MLHKQLELETCKYDLIWRVSADIIKLKIQTCNYPELGWALIQGERTVIIREGRQRGRPCEDRGRYWSNPSINQGIPWTASPHRTSKKARQDRPQSLQRERTRTLLTAWTSGLQTRERISFCGFKPPSLWHFVAAATGN